MGDKSRIGWTDASWNAVTGCSHVSEGCRACYAEALSLRHGWSQKPWTAPNAAENVVLHPDRLNLPTRWKKPRRIFVNSMSDMFHEQIPDDFIDRMFFEMMRVDRHIYQILTKRPERMREQVCRVIEQLRWPDTGDPAFVPGDDLPAHIWLGVSVEAQREADLRIPVLLGTPATVRFLSCEPLLSPIDLSRYLHGDTARCDACPGEAWDGGCPCHGDGICWVITGGESGPHYRPFDSAWAATIRDQCQAAGVAFYHKQGAGPRPGMDRLLGGRTWDELPEVAR